MLKQKKRTRRIKYRIPSRKKTLSVIILVLFFSVLLGNFQDDIRRYVHSYVISGKSQEPILYVYIPKQYQEIQDALQVDRDNLQGYELLAVVKMLKPQKGAREDFIIQYSILDKQNVPILEKKETVAIETQISLVKSFLLPSYIPSGTYYLHVVISSLNGEILARATSSFLLGVSKQNKQNLERSSFPIFTRLLVLSLLAVAFITIYRRTNRPYSA